jgi:hypothetical protein
MNENIIVPFNNLARNIQATFRQYINIRNVVMINLGNTYNLIECLDIPFPRSLLRNSRWRFREEETGQQALLANPLSTGRFVAVLVNEEQ